MLFSLLNCILIHHYIAIGETEGFEVIVTHSALNPDYNITKGCNWYLSFPNCKLSTAQQRRTSSDKQ
jgi:hypothetical protein